VTSEALAAAGHVTVSWAGQKRNAFSRYLKIASESLSLTVFVEVFQVCRAEKRKARLAKSVANERLRQLYIHCRVRTLSHVMTWWLRYVGIEVVRTYLPQIPHQIAINATRSRPNSEVPLASPLSPSSFWHYYYSNTEVIPSTVLVSCRLSTSMLYKVI